MTDDLVCLYLVVFHRHHGFPAKLSGILNRVELRSSGTVERYVKPVVTFEANGGLVFVGTQRHNANACTNRWPNADKCRLRNRAIDRKSGPAPAASHRNATTS